MFFVQEKPSVQPHLFPFMENDSSNQTYQSFLYKQVSLFVIAIAQAALGRNNKAEAAAVDALCDFCRCRLEAILLFEFGIIDHIFGQNRSM